MSAILALDRTLGHPTLNPCREPRRAPLEALERPAGRALAAAH